MNVAPGATFEATTDRFAAGSTVGVRIRDGQGADFLARTTAGVTEDVTVGSACVKRRTFTAPTVAGQFWLTWDDGVDIDVQELVVTHSRTVAAAPAGRDLCTLDDVLNLVPGYRQSDTVEAKLQELISAQSELIQEVREIVPAAGQPEELDFDIGYDEQQWCEIRVGDIATVEGLEVEVRTQAGDVVRTVDAADITPMYRFDRLQPRAAWEPIVKLRIRRGLTANRVLHVTATFGFPEIPPHIREACAKQVLLRYLSDVGGTQLSEAADNLNLAAMFASARDAVDSLNDTVYIR